MTTTKLPLVGWLKFFLIELNWIAPTQYHNWYVTLSLTFPPPPSLPPPLLSSIPSPHQVVDPAPFFLQGTRFTNFHYYYSVFPFYTLQLLLLWSNSIQLNVMKTKEMIIDFRKNKTARTPLAIREQVEFVGTTIANTLKWDINAEIITKKSQQCMFFLCQLKKFRVNKTIRTQFYWAVTESVLMFSITVWFGSASIHNKNMLEGIV